MNLRSSVTMMDVPVRRCRQTRKLADYRYLHQARRFGQLVAPQT
jgi:hypothetical protein